jgi:hypothetical protein
MANLIYEINKQWLYYLSKTKLLLWNIHFYNNLTLNKSVQNNNILSNNDWFCHFQNLCVMIKYHVWTFLSDSY